MKNRTAISLLVLVVLLAGVAAAAAAEKQVSDDAIFDNVRRRLASDAEVKGGALEVDVQQGVVRLRGSVETEKQKNRAERLTRKVDGVKKVINELRARRTGAR
jgi:hyperosmotically inducible periplasmic protein